jgi:hypothetical protein
LINRNPARILSDCSHVTHSFDTDSEENECQCLVNRVTVDWKSGVIEWNSLVWDTGCTSADHRRGAKIGEATAKAANRAEDAIAHGAVMAQIKSKMALDDLAGTQHQPGHEWQVVSLTDVVDSEAKRKRAVGAAKETKGVT